MIRRAILALGAWVAALAGPALAVGMGPLAVEGKTPGPAKAFYLTVYNPYEVPRAFRAYVEGEARNVTISPATLTIKPGGQRRIMVILRGIEPGETREARICAELAKQEGMIHARVCSALSATRLAPRR